MPPAPCISELLRRAGQLLSAVSDSPQLDAELLLADTLGKPRSHLYAWPDKRLDADRVQCFEASLARRLQGEPLAQILGHKEFWSLRLAVSPAVLTPRPDTETLVEAALKLGPPGPARVLDLGTGSGAIAAALARERAAWQVTATDASAAALAVAEANFQALGLTPRIRALRGDWFQACAGEVFDLVVSNPPYIRAEDPHLQQAELRHEPRSALVAGHDGLDDIRRIIAGANDHLRPGGWLLLEHGWDQAAAVRALLVAAGLEQATSRRDLAGHERVSGARRRRECDSDTQNGE